MIVSALPPRPLQFQMTAQLNANQTRSEDFVNVRLWLVCRSLPQAKRLTEPESVTRLPVVLPPFRPGPWATIPHRRARCRSSWRPAASQAPPHGQLTRALGPALYWARLCPTRRD
ncbi:hypothetical protein PtB15_13B229 [Puccinia triticina]|nr:hypothetical protein PtB15_13B229 [Puccinia triticina]